MKPNPYIEFSVDDKSPRKTEVSKSTYQPKWNEEFTILVTPYSQLHFRLLDHSTFRKDTLIGEKRINLFQVLSHYNGKLENLELTFDLMSESKHDSQLCKVGELITVFDGLRIDITNEIPVNVNEPSCQIQSDGKKNIIILKNFGNYVNIYNRSLFQKRDIKYLVYHNVLFSFSFFILNCIILGATNDTINNRSILNGGVRARMRLRSSKNLAPSIYHGLTNIHLSPSYNGENGQAKSSKSVRLSTSIPSADGTSSSNVGSSASSSSLSTSILVNGHAIPIADKSMTSPGNRHATDVRTFAGRSTVKEQSSASPNPSESQVYTWSNYSNADQSAVVKSDSRGPSRSDQSPSMISGQQICPDIIADARGIPRQDQSILSNIDSSNISQTDANVSSHADACGGASALRIEQPIVAALPDSRIMTRSEQSTNILLADDADLRGARQPDQSATIRRTSTTNEDQCAIRQQPEQSTNIRVTEDLTRGMRQPEQSTSVRAGEDLRAIRQSEQSTSVRPPEDLRTPRAEQSINATSLLDIHGVSLNQQNANVPLLEHRAVLLRPQRSLAISLTDERTIPNMRHMPPIALPDSRSNIPRIPQSAASLPSNQSVVVPISGQSVTQPGSSVVLTEDINHSEEPLPPGWEMKYDEYGRR